jgi:hypothetical protein
MISLPKLANGNIFFFETRAFQTVGRSLSNNMCISFYFVAKTKRMFYLWNMRFAWKGEEK